MKAFLKKITPKTIINWRRAYLTKIGLHRHDAEFSNRNSKDIFSEVYKRRMWGGNTDYFSGHGSHLSDHVKPYVEAVSQFLSRFSDPLIVVDLGCGDFNIGRQIKDKASNYIACDVVPDLIERNKEIYAGSGVNFRVLDITDDELPQGDIVLIRQVLQHLSNADIAKVVSKLHRYKYLVLTEHIPACNFIPNVDHKTGSYSRMARGINSGVVLTAPPFNLAIKSQEIICETLEQDSLLRVIVYEF